MKKIMSQMIPLQPYQLVQHAPAEASNLISVEAGATGAMGHGESRKR